jgi:hypothetical protein
MERILREDRIAPDCKPRETNAVAYAHRRLKNGDDIYFVANPGETPLRVTQQFRSTNRQPELWHPVTGAIRPLHGWSTETACTLIPLRFEPTESYFIVFRQPVRASHPAHATSSDFPALMPVQILNGPWRVEFDARWVYPVPSGAEGTERIEVVFDDLQDWTRRPEEGLRYYSGTAVYRQTFALAQDVKPGRDTRLWLDLGAVHSMARVRLNGRDLGVVWCPPWRVDITQAVTSSNNQLEIEVANLWVNRLVGDETLPPAERRTQTNRRDFKAGTPLMRSGLLGPVTIQVLDEHKAGE